MTKVQKYRSAFDIIGPIMIGPSSSHTAGAVRIGRVAGELFDGLPEKLTVTFYGSFAKTYMGHGTALAIVAGVMGFPTEDERIPDAIQHGEAAGIKIEFLTSDQETPHANTVDIHLSSGEEELLVRGISIGGGNIQITAIDGVELFEGPQLMDSVVLKTRRPDVFIDWLKQESQGMTSRRLPHNQESSLFVITGGSDRQGMVQTLEALPGSLAVLPASS